MYMYFKLNEIAHLLLHTHCSLFSDGGLCSFLWFVTTPCILSVSLNTGSQSFVKVCPGSTAVSAPVSQHISLQHDDHCVCACVYVCVLRRRGADEGKDDMVGGRASLNPQAQHCE